MPLEVRTSQCGCGRVRCESRGEPILSVVCYCLDCQEGGRRIEALPGARACSMTTAAHLISSTATIAFAALRARSFSSTIG